MVAASRPRPTPCATSAITPSTRLRTTCAKAHMQPKRLRMAPDGVAHPANNARVAMAACAHWSAHVDSRPQSTLRRAVVCAPPPHFARAEQPTPPLRTEPQSAHTPSQPAHRCMRKGGARPNPTRIVPFYSGYLTIVISKLTVFKTFSKLWQCRRELGAPSDMIGNELTAEDAGGSFHFTAVN